MQLVTFVLVCVEVPFWLFTFVLESAAMCEGLGAYFEDPWNYVDVIGMTS